MRSAGTASIGCEKETVGFFRCDQVGFLVGEAACEASADHVAAGASLGVGECVEAFPCLGADSDAVHLPGGLGHGWERNTALPNVSECDTFLGMHTTTVHTAHCIEMVKVSIDENNLDTLVEMGINERTKGLDSCAANKLIDAELEAAYADPYGPCSRPTDELAAEWLACGNVECQDEGRCGAAEA